MTIKDFAGLCGCNPQTLRYYDHVGLLKPVQVDPWTGYRYYDEEQAIPFVKIKNLQKAGFTIEEIKGLLDQDNQVIFDAFSAKIAEQEQRLREIKEIQQSYQTEMNEIQKKINEAREKITDAMRDYDPAEEFGIDEARYKEIIDMVDQAFAGIAELDPKEVEYSEVNDEHLDEAGKKKFDFLNDPGYETLYEAHGWQRAKEFFGAWGELETEREHVLLFRGAEGRFGIGFSNTVLGLILAENKGKRMDLSCSTGESPDGQNHFWLLRKR